MTITNDHYGPLLTPREVGQYLGVALGTLANWRYLRRGPAFVRVGGHIRYRAVDVEVWLKRSTALYLPK